uniref:CSON002584 protein n=1 Tax=Culicoides sonorensis TaxID=179676 RepID=A0A336LVZ4_CULSO
MKALMLMILFSLISNNLSLNVIMITLGGTKSHKIPFLEIGQGLINRNHSVTLLTGFKSETSSGSTLEDIAPKKVVEYISRYSNRDLLGARMKGELPIPILDVFRYPLEVCSMFYESTEVKLIMEKKFDVGILDGAFPECALAMIHKMQIPFIYLNTVGLYTGSLSLAGNPALASFTPAFSGQFTENIFLNFGPYIRIIVINVEGVSRAKSE